MTTQEILRLESEKNPNTLLLFREGLFLKAYESSAYLFHKFVKPYEIKKKHYKNIKSELISLGFPSTFLKSLIAQTQLQIFDEGEDGMYQLTSPDLEFSNEDYTQFKTAQSVGAHLCVRPVNEMHPVDSVCHVDEGAHAGAPLRLVADRLKQFDMANHTPLDCMNFLQELKGMLPGH